MAGGELDETLTADPSAPAAAVPATSAGAGIAAGSIILGRYEIRRFIAAGAMGEVYEARDRLVGATVAVKAIKPALADSPRALERFVREVALARKVTHPGVCRLHDVHEHEGRAFLSMELLAGESLADRLRRGPLAAAELDAIARQLVAALAALHAAGVVHRDLKSSNIMLVPDGGTVRAVITDFGLARSTAPVADAQLTGDATMLGTPAYMAPEQVEGREATPASDIYALGVVLFEMATGALPFQEETALATATARLTKAPPRPRERRAGLAPHWDRAILRCLERAPDARPRRVEDVLAPPRRRSWMRLAAAATGAGALAGAVWFAATRGEHATPTRPSAASTGEDTTCPSAATRLQGVWTTAEKTRIGARYEAHAKPFVRDAWRSHARQFDQLAAAWSERWDAACSSADRTADPLLHGQRLACLENQLFEIRSYVSGLAETAIDVEAIAVGSPGEFPIPPASECDLVAFLRAQVPPPPVAARAEIETLMAEFHRLRAALRFAASAAQGQTPVDTSKELARLDELRTRLLALEYPAGAGEVGYWYAEFLTWFDRPDDAERVRAEVVALAERTRDDALLVDALASIVTHHARYQLAYQANDSEATLQRATEIAARIGDPPFLLQGIAEARVAHTRRLEDMAQLLAALDELARRDAHIGLPAFALWRRIERTAVSAAHTGGTAAEVSDARRFLAEREAAVGPTHLLLGQDLLDLAPVFAAAGEHEAALAAAERAATILEQPALASVSAWSWRAHRVALAAAFAQGRRDVVARHLDAAIAAGRNRFGSPLAAHAALADELRVRGARAAAAHVLATAAELDGSDADRTRIAEVAAALRAETAPIVTGEPSLAVGRFRAARRALDPGLPWRARARGEADARYGIALLEGGAAAAAGSTLIRAVWIQELCCEGASVLAQESRFALARALVEVGGDRERALALARRAHAALAAMGPELAPKARAVEAWLARQR